MTKDNSGRRDPRTGDPGGDLEPVDVIKCRECGGLVRRVNNQHLVSDRCMYTQPEKVRTGEEPREDLLRPDHPETVEEYREMYPDAPVMAPAEKKKLSEYNRDPEVDERRRELLRRRWSGQSMNDAVEALASAYGVEESTIWKDWADRKEWLGRVFGLGDAETVVLESLAQKKNVRDRLNTIARRAEDENELDTARKALKAVDDNIDDTIEHQRKLGEVETAATKHEVEVSGEITHEPGEELDADTVEALDGITGGSDEDVVDADFEVVEDGGEGGGG